MIKYFVSIIISLSILLSPSLALAQYDTNQVTPIYRDNGEVYGIDIAASDRISFYPTGCESIDKVTIEAKTNIKGEIILRKLSDNPKKDSAQIDNAFEYCEFEFNGINENDIKKTSLDLKVRKSWLNEKSLNQNDISLFTHNNSDNAWVRENTAQKTESSIYYFYSAEANNFPYLAVGQQSTSILGSLNAGVLLLCCLLLLLLVLLIAFAFSSRRKSQS